MFIRAKRRKLKKECDGRSDWSALDFVLVESVRSATGPRQKIVGYIGTIEERLAHWLHIRNHFYKHALPRLKKMAPAREYRRLAKWLEEKVGAPGSGEAFK